VTALATSTPTSPKAHEMTPAFVFAGTRAADGAKYPLYRIYVFSDNQCVNTVFRGAIVGGPAYAARNRGTIKLPTDATSVADAATQILGLGDEGKSFTAEGIPSKPASEAGSAADAAATTTTPAPATGGSSPVEQATNSSWPQIELLESGWPNGRFFWTVVPVKLVAKVDPTSGKVTSYDYADAEVTQDACAGGRVLAFGKASSPVVAGQGSAYASGQSPTGRLIASAGDKPFYGHPLVAWVPAPGADTYEIEWSPTRYPWRAVRRIQVDGGTAASLPLKPGAWWYRVRGVNSALPTGRQYMTWSMPLGLTVAKPKFRLVASK